MAEAGFESEMGMNIEQRIMRWKIVTITCVVYKVHVKYIVCITNRYGSRPTKNSPHPTGFMSTWSTMYSKNVACKKPVNLLRDLKDITASDVTFLCREIMSNCTDHKRRGGGGVNWEN